ncbi:protein FAR1-RELATED SEQUENCE 5 [Artemisia annua]|uniref:Protein FAR1-RELATED SEQUENCE 5 n=1 Tax=Artemisia annua TaxID=35608 RepID=A0A2U1LU73_ARTAN|nr:protein FAR1-RELATED SEQUENCE 5 [Artemisia annua]
MHSSMLQRQYKLRTRTAIQDVQVVRVKDHVRFYTCDDKGERTWCPDTDIGDIPKKEGHNHPLVAEKDMIFMKSSCDLGYTKQHFLFQASNANFGPSTGFKLLKELCGGFDRVGATVVDCVDDKLVGYAVKLIK